MEDDTFFSIMIGIGAFVMVVLLVSVLKENKDTADIQLYAKSTQVDVVGIYPNTLTEQATDFFVATKNDGTVYVEVVEENGYYSHTETPVDGHESLMAMSQASLDEIQAEKTQENKSNTRIMFLPM